MSSRLPIYLVLILRTVCFGLTTCLNESHTITTDLGYWRRYRDENGDYRETRENVETINITITCSNIFSLDDIDYNYENSAPIIFIVQQSNLKTIEPISLTNCPTITELHLSENLVKTIKPRAFINLTNLKALYLNDNLIEELFRGVFNGLKQLEILDLRNNFLHKIEDFVFNGLNNLEQLYLGGNKIETNWNKSVQVIPDQAVLDLSNNSISNFTFYLESLTNLNLSYNNLRGFDFELLPKAVTLDLSFNHINHLNNSKEVQISNLYLYGNHLQNLTITFKKGVDIQSLDFGCNKLFFIRDNFFFDLKFLRFLNLSKNFLSDVSQVLFQDLFELRALNLSHNQISNFFFGTFDSLEKLEILDLSHNKLKQLHEYTFHSLVSLSKLYFDNNQIYHFSVKDLRSHLPRLTFVSLECNYWECKELTTIYNFFKITGVELKKGSYFESENVRGIACGVKIDPGVEKIAEVAEVVNDTFSKTNFFHFFENQETGNSKLTNENTPQNNSANKIIMIIVFMAIVLCTVLLVLLSITYFLFTKFRGSSQTAMLQMELN